MATLWVSNSTANGFIVGDDANAGTPAAPKLTITGALSAASASDTIKINDGTYLETNYVSVGAANITLSPVTDWQAIIRSTGTTRVLHQPVAGTGLTIGRVIIDGQGNTTYCISTDSVSNVSALTLAGTYLDNATGSALYSLKLLNLTAYDNWRVSGSALTKCAIELTVPAAGTISLSYGDVSYSGMSNANGDAIYISGGAAGVTLDIHHLTGTVGVANGTPTPASIYSIGCTTVSVHDNVMSFSGTLGNCSGAVVANSTVACTQCEVYDNTFTPGIAANSNATYGILIGADATSANDDSISGVKVWGNRVSGVNHGHMFGWITAAKGWGNRSDLATIGHIMKGTLNCRVEGAVARRISGSAFRSKGSRGGDVFSQYVHIIEAGYTGTTELVTDSSSAPGYVNGCAYGTTDVTSFTNVNALSTATFDNCNYYTTGAIAAGSWIFGATTYDTVAAWNGDASVSGCLNVDPQFVDEANDDYTPQNANIIGAGHNWWTTGPNPTGFDGEPFSDIDMDIGAIQTTGGAFHPLNI